MLDMKLYKASEWFGDIEESGYVLVGKWWVLECNKSRNKTFELSVSKESDGKEITTIYLRIFGIALGATKKVNLSVK